MSDTIVIKLGGTLKIKFTGVGGCDPTLQLVVGNVGPTGPAGAGCLWGEVILDTEESIVYSELFRHELAPYILIDGAWTKWYKMGIRQNKKDQPGEEDQTPFLDFSNYSLYDAGQGKVTGEIDFQYYTS